MKSLQHTYLNAVQTACLQEQHSSLWAVLLHTDHLHFNGYYRTYLASSINKALISNMIMHSRKPLQNYCHFVKRKQCQSKYLCNCTKKVIIPIRLR